MVNYKIPWVGTIIGVQPRIRLTRSFDQSSHSNLGYVLRMGGTVGGEQREFRVAIGKAAQVKHAFRMGDHVSGESEPVEDARTEVAELYKTSKLKVLNRPATDGSSPPPWLDVPPARSLPRARPSTARSEDVRREVHGLHVGVQDGRRNDHRPVEADQREVQGREFLLWAEVLLALSGGSETSGAGAEGNVVSGRRLGG